MLSKFVLKSQRNCNAFIHLQISAYKTTPQNSTDVSPNMMLRSEANLSLDIAYEKLQSIS